MLHCTRLGRLSRDKHSSLLSLFVCYEENEVVVIKAVVETLKKDEESEKNRKQLIFLPRPPMSSRRNGLKGGGLKTLILKLKARSLL